MGERKSYIGVKLLWAEPMSEKEFAIEQGKEFDIEKPDREGYRLEYKDGHYVSWSPKDVFDRAYVEMTRSFKNEIPSEDECEEWQVRVMSEAEVLGVKITMLEEYLKGKQDELLEMQLKFMVGYYHVLKAQIESWSK